MKDEANPSIMPDSSLKKKLKLLLLYHDQTT